MSTPFHYRRGYKYLLVPDPFNGFSLIEKSEIFLRKGDAWKPENMQAIAVEIVNVLFHGAKSVLLT
jgi:hypothetical protein